MPRRLPSLIGIAAAFVLLPAFALAQETAPADSGATQNMLDILTDEKPAILPAPPVMDGRGGGGVGISFPGPMGGVQVDASVTRDVTPDFIALNVYCDAGRRENRDTARETLQQIERDIRAFVGSDGRVRRTGGIGLYPVFDQAGGETGSYGGSLNLLIRIIRPTAAERIYTYVEDKNCSPNWDVRLVDTNAHESTVIDDLTRRLQQRKEVFEKLLSRRLTQVVSASLYTWVDGYSTYDPSVNKAEATTTLSVSYSPGENATIRTPRN